MSECCNQSSHTNLCPGCEQTAEAVRPYTLRYILHSPQNRQVTEQDYYYCRAPGCEVVYFSDSGERYLQADCRVLVHHKSDAAERPLCYCFDIAVQDVLDESGGQESEQFVRQLTKDSQCDCAAHNPSGKCCLRDFKALRQKA